MCPFIYSSSLLTSTNIASLIWRNSVNSSESISLTELLFIRLHEKNRVNERIKKYVPLSKRQDKPDSALWLIRQHPTLKDSQIAKLVGITKNSVLAIRNKSYWNYNNLNPKDPVALNLFTQKDLIEAIEKAERRIKREKKVKEKLSQQVSN